MDILIGQGKAGANGAAAAAAIKDSDTEHFMADVIEASNETPVIDQGLLDHALVNVHPLRNDRTTTMASGDLIRFIEACGHRPRILDLPG